ncbi:helix-turn-helix domain-containing protein [Streptomyces sp. NPDC048258]|uniref:helix-turn-helix domain-containing protein n=1 Tax=Streptomyces sp. NPDC048258 TaxID=3365527 RepID=UPI003714EE76
MTSALLCSRGPEQSGSPGDTAGIPAHRPAGPGGSLGRIVGRPVGAFPGTSCESGTPATDAGCSGRVTDEQDQAAYRSGLRRTTISDAFTGRNEPSAQTVAAIAMALRLPVDELLRLQRGRRGLTRPVPNRLRRSAGTSGGDGRGVGLGGGAWHRFTFPWEAAAGTALRRPGCRA